MDSKSLVEAYVLRKGPTYFFTSLNHHDKPIDLTSSADLSKVDFEPGKRLFRRYYTRRNDDEIPRLIRPETAYSFRKAESNDMGLSNKTLRSPGPVNE